MRLAPEPDPDAMERLKKRAQFLAAARGERWVSEAFVLQARMRGDANEAPRTGFTASRKVGNAVARNRARRRLKEAAKLVLDAAGRPGHDYVVVARGRALTHPFADILADLERAAGGVHRKLERKAGPGEPRRSEGPT
jgi:ribonuclease P protein component